MANKKQQPGFSIEELRQLLLERHKSARQERLEKFRRTGRAVRLVSDFDPPGLSQLRTEPLTDDDSDTASLWDRLRERAFDRTFLSIEIIVVIALFFILYNGFGLIQNINQKSVAELQQPTLTATPLIRNVVLPSGHTPPTSPGGARPNYAEIPAHLRP